MSVGIQAAPALAAFAGPSAGKQISAIITNNSKGLLGALFTWRRLAYLIPAILGANTLVLAGWYYQTGSRDGIVGWHQHPQAPKRGGGSAIEGGEKSNITTGGTQWGGIPGGILGGAGKQQCQGTTSGK